jgi:hypothetical protein
MIKGQWFINFEDNIKLLYSSVLKLFYFLFYCLIMDIGYSILTPQIHVQNSYILRIAGTNLRMFTNGETKAGSTFWNEYVAA